MNKIINLKKKKIVGKKEIIVIIVAVVLTTVGIKASDQFLNSEKLTEGDSICPDDMVLVDSSVGEFCIDKYESSANKDCLILEPNSIDESRLNLENSKCFPVSLANAIPWRNISRDQAELACAKAKKRLPTNKEWQQAALGTPDSKDDWNIDDCQVSNNWKEHPGYTGSGKNCISSAGAYDMIGNVWEWVSDSVVNGSHNNIELPDSGFVEAMGDNSIPGITNPNNPNKNYNGDYFWINKIGLRGIVRGGYWNNKTDAGQYSAYIINQPFQAEAGIGFRCVK